MAKVHHRDGRCTPPSPEDWSQHKQEIVDLYHRNPLDEVRREMLEKYNFRASKRMYDQRFKQWKVSKNLNKSRKEAMARQIASGHDASALHISPAEFRKVMRHVQAQAKRVTRSPLPVAVKIQSPDRSPGMEVQQGSPEGILSLAKIRDEGRSSTARSRLGSPPGTDVTVHAGRHFSEETSYAIPSIERKWSFSPGLRNMEFLTFTVRDYFDHKITELADNHAIKYIPGSEPGSVCKSFWLKVETAIYLQKKAISCHDERDRAVAEEDEARNLAAQALLDEPMDFIRRLFYTLSPTTTAACPPLRERFLQHIEEWASRILGRMHPLSHICGALMDGGITADVSRVILHQLYETAYEKLGYAHVVSAKLMQSVIAITRRAGDLEGAKSLAEINLDVVRSREPGRSIQSEGARTAARELAVVLTKLQEHGRAQELRLEAVESANDDDAVSVYMMEDIAEHEDNILHNFRRSAQWLNKAAAIASVIWGDTGATRHITDKLDDVILKMVNESEGQAGPICPADLSPPMSYSPM